MALYHRNGDKRRIYNEFRRQEEEVIGSLCRLGRPISPKTQLEQEKRIRREIANSNERRRMQSINAGFQSLRTLLPRHEGEKLSKAAILQHTAEYIYELEQEKTRLLAQNCQLKRLLNLQMNPDSDGSSSDSPLPKRKKTETVEVIEEPVPTVVMPPEVNETTMEDVRREMIELRVQLDRERKRRMNLEEEMRNLEDQLYPERIREIAQQVQLQYEHEDDYHGKKSGKPNYQTVVDTGLSSPEATLPNSEVDAPEDGHCISSPLHQSETPPPLAVKEAVSSKSDVDADINTQVFETDAAHEILPAEITVKQEPAEASRVYTVSTSRQNLETIVEAIRHLEGDRLFRDDPEPAENKASSTTSRSSTSSSSSKDCSPPNDAKQARHVNGSDNLVVWQQVLSSSPVTQSRPGVIVSNHS